MKTKVTKLTSDWKQVAETKDVEVTPDILASEHPNTKSKSLHEIVQNANIVKS